MPATALYRFFDANDVLLYVGITRSVPTRLAQHSQKAWCQEACRLTLEWFPDAATAARAELTAIRTENPRENIRDKPGERTAAVRRRARRRPRPTTPVAWPRDPDYRPGWVVEATPGPGPWWPRVEGTA